MKVEKQTRFYDSEGNPQWDCGLREARKQGYYPSHTSILNVLSKPGLEIWKQNELIKTCWNNPSKNETLQEYMPRISEIQKEERSKAPDLGSTIHSLIERTLRNECIQMMDYSLQIQQMFFGVNEWIRENIVDSILIEPSLVNRDFGYAGRPDLVAEIKDEKIALIDWKTSKTEPGKKPRKYREWCYQLAAQMMLLDGLQLKVASFMNVIISSTEPGRVEIVEWSFDDILQGWEVYQSCLKIWKIQNKFDIGNV